MALRTFISSFLIFLVPQCAFPQVLNQALKKTTALTLTVSPVYGFVIPHDPAVQNTSGTRITGAEITLSRIRLDEEARHYVRKSFNSGFTLAYYRFSKDFLGKALYGSYFIEPYFVNNRQLRVGLMAKLGLSYNSNPYDEITNNQNNSYSLLVNPYLCLGLNADISISDKAAISLDVMFNHNSNGGIYHPNYGINFPTAALGAVYNLKKYKTDHITRPLNPKWRIDMSPFACAKSIPLERKHFYGVYGLSLQVARKAGFFNTITLGTEWVKDRSATRTLELEGYPGLNPTRIGILAGHEFIFNKFNFTQQLGFYIVNRVPYISRLYHRWGLYYKLHSKWMAGFNLSAHKQVADFLDIRIIRSIGLQ